MKLNLLSAPFAHPLQRAPLQLFGLLWLIALPFALLSNGSGASDSGPLALLACLCMMLHGGLQMEALRNAGTALHGMRAPTAAWTGHARLCLQNISLGWLLLTTAMTLRCSLPSFAAMHWTSAGAMLSLAACLGAAIPLRSPGLLPRAWSWLAYTAIAALLAIVVAQVLFETQTLLAWLDAQPAMTRVSLMLAWPAMAGLLYLQWFKQQVNAPAGASAITAAPGGPHVHALRHLQRYTLLNEGILQIDGSMKPLGLAQRCIFLLLTPMQSVLLMRATWGEQLDGNHFMGVFAVSMVAASGLLMRDLHWRHLLAPGGLRARGIAFHIYFSTLPAQLALTLILGLFVALLHTLLERQPLTDVAHKLWMFSVVVPELALATAVAVLLRACRKWVMALYALLLIPVTIFNWSSVGKIALSLETAPALNGKIPLVQAGPVYAAALLLATCAVLLLARRVWTQRKLQPYLHGRG